MKLTILTLAFAVLAAIPQVFAMDDMMHKDKDMAMEKAPVTAVMFFSENCGSCKILDPRMKEALSTIEEGKVDVVVFDFTNKDKIAETKSMATEKGLDGVLQEFGARTGFVALVDGEGNITDKINVSDNTSDMTAKLNKAIASAS